MKTYTVTYQSQGHTLSEAKRNLRDLFEHAYGRGELAEELVNGLTLEAPSKANVALAKALTEIADVMSDGEYGNVIASAVKRDVEKLRKAATVLGNMR
jgi:hypothetical protein